MLRCPAVTIRIGWLAALYTLLVCCSAALSAAPAEHAARLAYSDSAFSHSFGVAADGREVVFKKEPALSSSGVWRGVIAGGGSSGASVAFAWDKEAGTLIIDQNRNLDLTDDVTVRAAGVDPYSQQFADVGVSMPKGDLALPYVVDADFYSYGRGFNTHQGCSLTVHSGWQGEVTLHGTAWHLAVADNLDGVIDAEDLVLLRRVGTGGTAGDEELQVRQEVDRILAGRTLCVGGHAYKLEFAFEPGEDAPALVATFTETETPRGTVLVEGSHIERLRLDNETHCVVIDRPGDSTLTVPAGSYHSGLVLVAAVDSSAVFLAASRYTQVTAGRSTTVRIGGPLNHTVAVRRSFGTLQFDYKLVGVGGQEYSQRPFNYESGPTVSVHRNGEKVHSGSFEYG